MYTLNPNLCHWTLRDNLSTSINVHFNRSARPLLPHRPLHRRPRGDHHLQASCTIATWASSFPEEAEVNIEIAIAAGKNTHVVRVLDKNESTVFLLSQPVDEHSHDTPTVVE
jgi:hypothetical protein